MNYYAVVTAETSIPCSKKEFNKIKKILETATDELHGFDCKYQDKGIFVFAEENGCESVLPYSFFEEMGKLIKKAGRSFLRFGVAQYADRLIPDSTHGYSFRITSDGSLDTLGEDEIS